MLFEKYLKGHHKHLLRTCVTILEMPRMFMASHQICQNCAIQRFWRKVIQDSWNHVHLSCHTSKFKTDLNFYKFVLSLSLPCCLITLTCPSQSLYACHCSRHDNSSAALVQRAGIHECIIVDMRIKVCKSILTHFLSNTFNFTSALLSKRQCKQWRRVSSIAMTIVGERLARQLYRQTFAPVFHFSTWILFDMGIANMKPMLHCKWHGMQ